LADVSRSCLRALSLDTHVVLPVARHPLIDIYDISAVALVFDLRTLRVTSSITQTFHLSIACRNLVLADCARIATRLGRQGCAVLAHLVCGIKGVSQPEQRTFRSSVSRNLFANAHAIEHTLRVRKTSWLIEALANGTLLSLYVEPVVGEVV
jgi:hypothetical protein